MLRDSSINLYQKNAVMVYDYGLKKKLVRCRSLRRSGFELETKPRERGTASSTKEESNLARARQTIYELAFCNPWELFITLTLNPSQYDRTDLKGYQRSLSQWIRNYNKKHGLNIKYLLIPETHKDGAWHMHGFLMGLPKSHLREFTVAEHLPYYILNKIDEGDHIYDWTAYREKFGFVDIEAIRSHEKVTKYVTKYVTKDLSRSVTELNANMYYCSKGLQRKTLLAKGTLDVEIPDEYWDFHNDYVAVKWYSKDIDVESSVIPDVPLTTGHDPEEKLNGIISEHYKNIKTIEERQLHDFTELMDGDYCPFE